MLVYNHYNLSGALQKRSALRLSRKTDNISVPFPFCVSYHLPSPACKRAILPNFRSSQNPLCHASMMRPRPVHAGAVPSAHAGNPVRGRCNATCDGFAYNMVFPARPELPLAKRPFICATSQAFAVRFSQATAKALSFPTPRLSIARRECRQATCVKKTKCCTHLIHFSAELC